MSKDMAPRIEAVKARAPYVLEVDWKGGGRSVVDVTVFLTEFDVYSPLFDSPEIFSHVAPDEYGVGVAWTHEIDMSGFTLARLARDQGQPVPDFTDPFRTPELTTR